MKQKFLKIYYILLWKLAKHYLNRHKPEVIWITGSIGKTSARMIISQVLSTYLKNKIVYTSEKNFNGEFGMSLSILWIDKYEPSLISLITTFVKCLSKSLFAAKLYDVVVLEYGIDHIGEMDFLLSIARPNISLVTKIDKVHSLQFGNPDITANEKYQLVRKTLETSFINFDDSYGRSIFDTVKVDKFYYSSNANLHDEEIDIDYENYKMVKTEYLIKASFDIRVKWNKFFNITSNLLGKENIWYIWVGFTILDIYFYKFYGKSFFESNKGNNLEINFQLQPSRFNIFKWINKSILVDSTYNAAPLSMRKVIENVVNLRNEVLNNYKLIFCLGDMRELWSFAEKEHRELAWFVSQSADKIWVVGENMNKYFIDELSKLWYDEKSVFGFMNSTQAGESLKEFLQNSAEKYLILFKWSQNTIFMEETLKKVLENSTDINQICRQGDYWMSKKK